jgi:hypothetical protein
MEDLLLGNKETLVVAVTLLCNGQLKNTGDSG